MLDRLIVLPDTGHMAPLEDARPSSPGDHRTDLGLRRANRALADGTRNGNPAEDELTMPHRSLASSSAARSSAC